MNERDLILKELNQLSNYADKLDEEQRHHIHEFTVSNNLVITYLFESNVNYITETNIKKKARKRTRNALTNTATDLCTKIEDKPIVKVRKTVAKQGGWFSKFISSVNDILFHTPDETMDDSESFDVVSNSDSFIDAASHIEDEEKENNASMSIQNPTSHTEWSKIDSILKNIDNIEKKLQHYEIILNKIHTFFNTIGDVSDEEKNEIDFLNRLFNLLPSIIDIDKNKQKIKNLKNEISTLDDIKKIVDVNPGKYNLLALTSKIDELKKNLEELKKHQVDLNQLVSQIKINIPISLNRLLNSKPELDANIRPFITSLLTERDSIL